MIPSISRFVRPAEPSHKTTLGCRGPAWACSGAEEATEAANLNALGERGGC